MMMRFAAYLSQRIKSFAGDNRGAVAVLIASGIVVLVATVGMATDAARGYLLKARLAQALDAAALAGGRAFFSPTRDQEIQAYFDANFPPGFLDAVIDGPHITVDETAGTVFLTASGTIDTTFMRALGVLGYDKVDTLTVAGATEVTRETKALDLVISIDMSGSMAQALDDGSGSRIEAARQAALDLIDILFGADSFKDLLNIGVVPWNSKVNVTINGSTYDPDGNISQPVSTPYEHPFTTATVNDHWFAANSPVPLLAPPPGRATTYTYTGPGEGLRFYDSGDWIRRYDGKSWKDEGFAFGSEITVANAEDSDHNGTYTIVGFGTSSTPDDRIKVFPSINEDDGDDTSATVSGVYHWPGCVYARYIPKDPYPSCYPNCDSGVTFAGGSDPEFGDDADTDLYAKDFQAPKDTDKKWAAWEPITGESESLPGSEECPMSRSGAECTICLTHGITPLKNTKQDVVDAIDELVAPEGSTNLAQGLAWAWRVLMPGAPFAEATANDDLTSDRQQAIILLSDGQNQGWDGDSYKVSWGRDTTEANGNINERLKTLAARIKDYHNVNPHARQGPIEIYAIQFAYQDGAQEALMKEVASKPTSPYYHFAPDRATLQSVFREVANHLSQLRISQ